MSGPSTPGPPSPDPERLHAAMNRVAERSRRIVQAFAERQASGAPAFNPLEPGVVSKTYQTLWQHMLADPARLVQAQISLWQDYAKLWESTARRMAGEEADPVAAPDPGDRRFKDDAWTENPIYDHIRQSYLLASKFMLSTVRETDGLDAHTAQKADFYTRQFIDALAPTNFAATNPEVVRRTVETGGENLVQGLENMLEDLERGQGRLRIRMTDLDKFKLGGNVAVTPGKVVFENDLMQLIQYAPATDVVRKRPLLIVPPWINKFYILDLRPKNSFIKWAVEQGHTVFVISWVNPDERLAEKSLDDYMLEGPVAALDAVEQATGEPRVNAIGYCLGGTLLAATLAYLKAKGRQAVESATFFTTMVDFEEPGELGVFIDDEQLSLMEEAMEEKGYFDGASMAEAFNLLRANDLIWSFVVNNYLMGKEPFPFDLLYWNSDSTRMPRAMHSAYLREMYRHNRLREPGGVTLGGAPIRPCHRGRAGLHPVHPRGPHRAVALHLRGHPALRRPDPLRPGECRDTSPESSIPPAANKYGYYTGALAASPDAWLEAATAHEGSWWPDWDAWVSGHGGGEAARARTGRRRIAGHRGSPRTLCEDPARLNGLRRRAIDSPADRFGSAGMQPASRRGPAA